MNRDEEDESNENQYNSPLIEFLPRLLVMVAKWNVSPFCSSKF